MEKEELLEIGCSCLQLSSPKQDPPPLSIGKVNYFSCLTDMKMEFLGQLRGLESLLIYQMSQAMWKQITFTLSSRSPKLTYEDAMRRGIFYLNIALN